MGTIYLAFIFMPFILSLGLFLSGRKSQKLIAPMALGAGLLWMILAGYSFYQFSFSGMNFFTIDWKYLSYLGFSIGMKINFSNLLLATVNSILLLITIMLLNPKDGDGSTERVCLAFVVTGVVNCALMAKSLYTFFILSEVIFLIHYCCYRIFSKEKIVLVRVLNTIVSVILFLIILRLGRDGYDFSTLGADVMSFQGGMFFGILLYFLVKLFLFPFHGQSKDEDNSLGIINNILVSNAVFILYVYGFKQYVIDIFPSEFKIYASSGVLVLTMGGVIFCILSMLVKNFLDKQILIKRSLTCLMLGAFLSFNKDVYAGIFTVLISYIFSMIAFYIFFHGKESRSDKYSKKEAFFLAVILYSLAFFPLSGGFIGFCKMLLGYKSIHFYSLGIIFLGLLFLFITLMKIFFKLLEEGFSEKNALSEKATTVISICLMVIFFIGINPILFGYFM